MSLTLEESYRHCRRITRSRARNFYYSFVLLDDAKRDAVCAVYAFMRHCDDLSDDLDSRGPEAALESLESWRKELEAALVGQTAGGPIWPAFHDTVSRYGIPTRYFHEMIDGVSSDLRRNRFETFEELYRYCYQVASVAGLSVVHIFGFGSEEALPLAEKCGIAFQLTNILRDIREDAGRGRIYLPREDLRRFGVEETQIDRGAVGPQFAELVRFQASRARAYYTESMPLVELVNPSCRSSLWALIEIYSRLLERIERSADEVLRRRIRLSWAEKSWILLRGMAGAADRRG